MIKAKFFNTIGDDLDALVEFLNEIGHENIIHLNTTEDAKGNRGAHLVYNSPDDSTNQTTEEDRGASEQEATNVGS